MEIKNSSSPGKSEIEFLICPPPQAIRSWCLSRWGPPCNCTASLPPLRWGRLEGARNSLEILSLRSEKVRCAGGAFLPRVLGASDGTSPPPWFLCCSGLNYVPPRPPPPQQRYGQFLTSGTHDRYLIWK